MILVGSRALALRAPSLLSRDPIDFDFICTQDEYESFLKKNYDKINPTEIYPEKNNTKMVVKGDSICEFELIQPNTSNQIFADLVEKDPDSIKTSFGLIPNLDLLFTLKTSHRYLKNSPFVFKTLIDWHSMRNAGAVIRPEYKEFLKLREKETYSYKHPSLTNQTKESFFSAAHGVQYIYEHDSIHQAVKHLDKPAYEYYAKDGDPIKSDREKFFKVDEKIRLYGALEECSTLAIERAIAPNKHLWTIEGAWKFAFSKVITSITSGFFRQWCYENAFLILKNYPSDYYDKFLIGLENGTVRYIKENERTSNAMSG